MSDKSPTSCSGNCVPLYLFGGISILGIGAQFIYSNRKKFTERFWDASKATLWALLFGALIYFICRNCKPLWGYGLLIVPSLVFGLNMFWLLVNK